MVIEFPTLVSGRFLRRENRFRATVSVGEARVAVHVPNSGRLADLLQPGRPVWLARAAGPQIRTRRTAYDLLLAELAGGLVSVDARLPNALFAAAFQTGRLAAFPYGCLEAEVRLGDSRLDFRLTHPRRVESARPPDICWVETKSVTLVAGDTALFPDVPTQRGRRHLRHLIARRRQGEGAAVVFVIQRADARRLAAHQGADPGFATLLAEAVAAGVMARAFTCRVTRRSISLAREVPVVTDPAPGAY